MIKFGVTDLSGLRSGGLRTLLGGNRYVSVRLLSEISALPGEEVDELFAAALRRLTNPQGAFRRTQRGRFLAFNEEILDLLGRPGFAGSSIRVHDAAVADGSTAVEFFRRLTAPNAPVGVEKFLATDLGSELILLCRFGSRFTAAIDGDTQVPVQLIAPPFVFNLPKGENPLWYPANALVRRFLSRFVVPRLLRDWESGHGDIAEERIELLHPEVRREVTRSAGRFRFERGDILDPRAGVFDLVRAMNVLNASYFSQDVLQAAIRALAGRLRDGGILLIGGDGDSPGMPSATAFVRTGDRLNVAETWKGGAMVESVALDVRLPDSRGERIGQSGLARRDGIA